MQAATGSSVVVLVVHDVVVYPLAAVGPEAVQLATATFDVLLGVQVVAVQLFPAVAVIGEHEATPVGPVVAGAGQVVVV